MYPKIKNIPKQQKQQAAFCRIALRGAWVLPRPHPRRSPCDRFTFKSRVWQAVSLTQLGNSNEVATQLEPKCPGGTF